MCSICGILGDDGCRTAETLKNMSDTMRNRGPDQSGTYFSENVAFAHNRLAVIDVENGRQPMTRTYMGSSYTIVYNGELYNTPELNKLIRAKGVKPATRCDTETVLYMYILFGRNCVSMLNGIFAFAVYDESRRETFFARDRFGVKPLFYSVLQNRLVFASEIKALLRYPEIRPEIDQKGLWELLFLAPVRLPGGVFMGIDELKPAHFAVWDGNTLTSEQYWALDAYELTDGREDIIINTRDILTDAIKRQLVSDVPLCTLLSGGLDSSIISSVAAEEYAENGMTLSTYSFEYEGNRENFHESMFQPQSDDDYAVFMASWLGTEHHVLTAPTAEVARLLKESALARDFPGQADIDSSLLYYCGLIKNTHTVAISGECADEIFGGYPWFYRPEMLESRFFPWIHDPLLRPSLFDDRIVKCAEGYEYLSEKFRESMANCPVLDTDTEAMRASRMATWLSVNFFMSSLLERKDRMSMAASVEVRVPYADHRIIEYVYNVPWEIKFENGTEKALLRSAMADYLPREILNRRKSPYPKTHNPKYEAAVLDMLFERLGRKDSPLGQMLDRKKLNDALHAKDETWFGQLMSRAQLFAWLYQFDVWAKEYKVDFV